MLVHDKKRNELKIEKRISKGKSKKGKERDRDRDRWAERFDEISVICLLMRLENKMWQTQTCAAT